MFANEILVYLVESLDPKGFLSNIYIFNSMMFLNKKLS